MSGRSYVCGPCVEEDHNVVSFCRRVLKARYRSYWLYPVYIDDTYLRYTDNFYKEVGLELLPKLTTLPKFTKAQIMSGERERIIYDIVWKDYKRNVYKGVKPKFVVIKGVRTPKGVEKIISVQEVKKLDEAKTADYI